MSRHRPSQTSTLVKTALYKFIAIYCLLWLYLAFLMMKTFSLRCHRLLFAKLPIYIQRNFLSIKFDPNPTATKLTLVEAEIRRSVNDHHHRHHGRHHRGHHHHHCLAWSCKGSYFGYLINWTIFLYIWKIFVLLSSAGLFLWCSHGPTIQYNTIQYKATPHNSTRYILFTTPKANTSCYKIQK